MITCYPVRIGLLIALAAVVNPAAAGAQEIKTVDNSKLPLVEMSKPEDSGIKAILGTNPTTPSECARAAKILADLQRPDLAKKFLKRVLDAKLDGKQLAALEAEFGSAMFVSMAVSADLSPEGKQVADAVLQAAEKELTDPQRLAGLVKQLQDPSAEVRYQAMDALRRARGAAVGPLVAVLADAGRSAESVNVRAMLVRLGRDAVQPLIAALDSSEARLQAEVGRVLADLDAREAILYLTAPCVAERTAPEARQALAAALVKLTGHAPTRPEATRLLTGRAREYFEQLQPFSTDETGLVEIWSWDAAAKQPVAKRYAPDAASRFLAVRLARDAYGLSPEDPAVRKLYLATLLEQATYERGLDQPLPTDQGSPAAIAGGFDGKVLEDVLTYAMDSGHTTVATAVVRMLPGKAKAEELLNQGPQPAPLVRATRSPDRRLRFAAVEAIFKLQPTKPFAGSSQVPEALAFFGATTGSRRVLVADSMRAEALRVGGLLTGMGYQVDTAVTGPELLRLAIAGPDYEVVLIAASMGEMTVEQTVQQLRYDCRTAWLPVGVLGRVGQADLTSHLAGSDRLTIGFVRPHTSEAAAAQAAKLLGRLGPLALSQAERQAQATQALAWVGQLIGQRQTVFDVRHLEGLMLAADQLPALAPQAAAILGKFGTAKTQQALVEQASQSDQPLAVRKAAVAAFRESVEKHGVLLTSQQILLQYDRYNRSAALDRPTQQVLGFILDCIEARTKTEKPTKGTENHGGKPSPPEGPPTGK
jgi:CheY-like chemotaxis protein